MQDFYNKPEDFDAIIHGETRIVLVEKIEEISSRFPNKMIPYCLIVEMNLELILKDLALHKAF